MEGLTMLPLAADVDAVIVLLKEQISRDQTYIYALALAIAGMGAFFGKRLLTEMINSRVAAEDQAASNRELKSAVEAQTTAMRALAERG